MRNTKLIIAISELWTGNQRSCARNCILRGIEEINKRFDINDIIEELNSRNIEEEIDLEKCKVQTMINPDKFSLLKVVKEDQSYGKILIIYVGPVTAPLGHWLLCDGIVSAMDVMELMNNVQCKLVISTLAPCDDWLTTEKKNPDSVCVCNYDMSECGDPIAFGLCDFVDSLCRGLKINPCSIKKPDETSFLKTAHPSVCGFLDKCSSCMPCLVLIDGFSMLFNVGYGRNPEMRHHLKYISQVDATMLTHLSYSNILPLSATADDRDTFKVNHIFLPYGVSVNDKACPGDSDNPYIVDLNNEIVKVLSGYKDKGTSVSNVFVKGKSGTPVSASQLKPIPLFQKIGYGSLELIALSPFEEDADVKKCCEDLKKGKYINDSVIRPLPSSVSALLLWRPFNPKSATKRFLYIGPRSQLRKNLPAVVATLYSNHECLKEAQYSVWDAANQKKTPAPRKVQPSTTKPPGTTNDSTMQPTKKVVSLTNSEKPAKAVVAGDAGKKTSTPTHSSKSPRSAPAAGPTGQTKPKEAQTTKRPTSGTSRLKSDAPSSTTQVKTPEHKKTTQKSPSAPPGTKPTGPKIKPATKVEASAEAKPDVGNITSVVNGDMEHNPPVTDTDTQDEDAASDPGKMVAIGTVECAITEHGEADFCDDTPEEFSAEQMKEMGLYDDDEDRSSAPLSDRNDLDDGDCDDGAEAGNMAHMPMEGSFYGKDSFTGIKDHSTVNNWQAPLGLPMPAREVISATKKSGKCATPIHVDCVCVPCDLDKEDLRCLLQHVRFTTGFWQLERPSDLARSLDVLMEEWVSSEGEVTVVPSIEDEATLAWITNNATRLAAARVKIAPGLSRSSIVIGGGLEEENRCLGYRCDL